MTTDQLLAISCFCTSVALVAHLACHLRDARLERRSRRTFQGYDPDDAGWRRRA